MEGGAGLSARWEPLLLEQHAILRLRADEHLVTLGHRVRRSRAHDELPAVPVHVVLREIALEHALADPGRPRVDGRLRARALEAEADGADGHERLGPAPAVGRGAVDQGSSRRLYDHEPIALEV